MENIIIFVIGYCCLVFMISYVLLLLYLYNKSAGMSASKGFNLFKDFWRNSSRRGEYLKSCDQPHRDKNAHYDIGYLQSFLENKHKYEPLLIGAIIDRFEKSSAKKEDILSLLRLFDFPTELYAKNRYLIEGVMQDLKEVLKAENRNKE